MTQMNRFGCFQHNTTDVVPLNTPISLCSFIILSISISLSVLWLFAFDGWNMGLVNILRNISPVLSLTWWRLFILLQTMCLEVTWVHHKALSSMLWHSWGFCMWGTACMMFSMDPHNSFSSVSLPLAPYYFYPNSLLAVEWNLWLLFI